MHIGPELQAFLENLLKAVDAIELHSKDNIFEVNPKIIQDYLKENCPAWNQYYFEPLELEIPSLEQITTLPSVSSESKVDPNLDDIHEAGRKILHNAQKASDSEKEKAIPLQIEMGIHNYLKTLCLLRYLICPALFGIGMPELLSRIKKGDRDAMLKMVQLDKSFIGTDPVQKEIRKAQLNGDSSFFKSICGALEKNPFAVRVDNYRLYIFLIHGWELGLFWLSQKELFELVKNFGLYNGQEDSFEKFVKNLPVPPRTNLRNQAIKKRGYPKP